MGVSAVRYVVGFDPSTTRFGVACGSEADGAPKSFVWKLPGADERVFDRTLGLAFENALELFKVTHTTDVVIEAPIILRDRSSHTMEALMQLTGALRAAAHRHGCTTLMVASSTVRRHFIGVGNLKSKDAKLAVQARCRLLGWAVEDDNAADAVATWSYAMALLCPRWSPRSTPLFAKLELAHG